MAVVSPINFDVDDNVADMSILEPVLLEAWAIDTLLVLDVGGEQPIESGMVTFELLQTC